MSKEIVNYDQVLADMAKVAAAAERPSGKSISTKSGVLSYGGVPCPGNKLDVIVVASVFSNTYYEDRFDSANLSSPVCYSYGESEEELAPHPASAKPQAETCDACPQNKWGTAPNGGRGKACKNGRVLAVIPANSPDIASAEIAILKPPVTSVKNWQMYVSKCAALYNRPPLALVTQVGTVPDQKTQYQVTFTDVVPVDVSLIKDLLAKVPDALAAAQKVYEVAAEPAQGGKF